MKPDRIRRRLVGFLSAVAVWLFPALALAAIFTATAHMDYSSDPGQRKGDRWIVQHGGMILNIPVVVDRAAPCIPARTFRLARTLAPAGRSGIGRAP